MVENNYEINFAETTDEIFRGKLENVTRIDQTSLFLEGQNREVKMSVSKSVSNGKLSQTFFFTTVVIDHNFIPASQLSQTPFSFDTPLSVNPSFEISYTIKTFRYIKKKEKVAIPRIYSQNQNHLNKKVFCH